MQLMANFLAYLFVFVSFCLFILVTIGTKARIVIYQHLFAQNCIFEQDTIGYKRYNYAKKLAIPTT